jgi:hypothetical protein
MAGQQVRGRYPLTSLWLLADRRNDNATLMRVRLITRFVAAGHTSRRKCVRFDTEYLEQWLARYADGEV